MHYNFLRHFRKSVNKKKHDDALIKTTQILSSLFSLSLFTFAFSFSLLGLCVEEMWVLGRRSDIVPIVWVLFCFLQTINWVQVWVPNKNLSEIKKKKRKKRELWIELRIVSCELWEWELSFENWDMDVLRTKHSINFQIFYHSCICPIWALN